MNIPSLTPLLYGFSVYSCHLFLVFSASVRSLTVSALYHAHLCMKHSLDISYFLKSSLVFPIILFSSVFLYCSFKEAFLSLLAILLYLHSGGYIFPFLPWLLLLFFTQLFVKPLHHNKTVIHEGNSDNYHIPISTRKHIYFPFPVAIFVLIFSYLYPNQALPSDLKWPRIGVSWELTILK